MTFLCTGILCRLTDSDQEDMEKQDYQMIRYSGVRQTSCSKCNTVTPVSCDLPNMVIYDRWSLNTGLIDMKCTVKGN